MELAWGSRHLSEDQLEELFTGSGFARREFLHTAQAAVRHVGPCDAYGCLIGQNGLILEDTSSRMTLI